MTITLDMIEGLPVYGPVGQGPVPAVLILHGTEGPMAGWGHRFAAILAAQGLLAAPFSYGSGDFWGAGAMAGIDLAQVVSAGQTLARHPRAGSVGLFGWSFGGAMALVVAALQGPGGPFAAVAAHAGADRITPSFDPVAFRAGRGFLDILPEAPRAFVWEGLDDHLAPGAPLPLDDLHLPVFLSVGLADPVWPADMTQANAARLTALGRPPEVFSVPGQGHGFDFDREPELWARLVVFFGKMFEK